MPRYEEEKWQSMLSMLSERDAPVELSRRESKGDGLDISYRTRLFGMDPQGCIIVERPSQAVQDKTFEQGDDIELLLMHNDERLVGTCTIKQILVREINTDMRVSCYLLSPARRPQRDQRRSFFRAGIAAEDLEPALLSHEDDGNTFEFKAKMVNVSAGGLGVSVRLSRTILNQIKRTRDYRCQANFGQGQTIDLPARVTHVLARGEDGLYLGLEFVASSPAIKSAIEDQLHQLCTEFQRKSLRRKRA